MVSRDVERRKALIPAALPRSSMRRGDFVAEILEDRRGGVFHCLVQQRGSPEVLFYCQSATEEEIKRVAEEQLHYYAENRGSAKGGK